MSVADVSGANRWRGVTRLSELPVSQNMGTFLS